MPDTVVLGGGIIGLSTAYYLAKLTRDAGVQHNIHIVEPSSQLFSSASGKAGGFLAKDWFNPTMAPLGELSFRLHKELAEQNDGRAKWGYAPVISYSLDRYASSHGDSDSESNRDTDSEPPVSPLSEQRSLEGETRDETQRNGHATGQVNETEVPPRHNQNRSSAGEDWMEAGESRVVAVEQRLAEASERPVGAGAEEQAAAALALANADAEAAALAEENAATAKLDDPLWLRAKPHALQAISDKTTTAQCNPQQLCEFLLNSCLAMGVRLHHPALATHLYHADSNDPASQTMLKLTNISKTGVGRTIRTASYELPVDSLVVAAGCWTPDAFRTLFPDAPRPPTIDRHAGYSVRVRSRHWQPAPPSAPAPYAGPCHAVFTSDPSGFSPELFTRVASELWIGGVNDSQLPLTDDPTDTLPDPDAIERMLAVGRELCGDDIEVIDASVCFRPVTPTRKPFITRVDEKALGAGVVPQAQAGAGVPGGVYVAAGHGPWGISMSLGTGLVVAEMVLGRETSADVKSLGKW
ncbi:FAD dependent oxidoreductase [Daedalea quercina L-15889]|uniref:FAD dependent oxidoreductase n=1 Tax=Daedalea quercina L-15889 TaxID=1314783 RepID=A0A165S225_9APHY|nr:FAD dependent oxidoreductase [Daedalea quercina L-15889]